MTNSSTKLSSEPSAFLAIKPELTEKYPDKLVLFKFGEVQGIYDSFDEAYADGLRLYGPDEAFLIEDLAETVTPTISLSWLHGLIHVHS